MTAVLHKAIFPEDSPSHLTLPLRVPGSTQPENRFSLFPLEQLHLQIDSPHFEGKLPIVTKWKQRQAVSLYPLQTPHPLGKSP